MAQERDNNYDHNWNQERDNKYDNNWHQGRDGKYDHNWYQERDDRYDHNWHQERDIKYNNWHQETHIPKVVLPRWEFRGFEQDEAGEADCYDPRPVWRLVDEPEMAGDDADSRRQRAAAFQRDQEAVFRMYDVDGDGFLNWAELGAYARGEFQFTMPDDMVEKLLWACGGEENGGVPADRFQQLKVMVGVERVVARDALERAAAERRRQERDARRAVLQGGIDVVGTACEAVREAVAGAESLAQRAPGEVLVALKDYGVVDGAADVEGLVGRGPSGSLTVRAMYELADRADEAVQRATKELALARGSAERLESGVQLEEDRPFVQEQAQKLICLMDRCGSRLSTVTLAMQCMRNVAKKKAHAKLDQLRAEAVEAVQAHLWSAGKKVDDLLGGVDAVRREEFTSFLGRCGVKLADEQLEELFAHLRAGSGGADRIPKDDFVRLFAFSAVYYRVCKPTALTNSMSIRGSTMIRRLLEDEVFESDTAPKREEATGVMRVHGRAVIDGVDGWVTIAGNEGSVFLVEGADLFEVAVEVDLTSEFVVSSGTCVRELERGEKIRVVEWEKRDPSGAMRLKGTVLSDNAVGWVTRKGARGTSFLRYQ